MMNLWKTMTLTAMLSLAGTVFAIEEAEYEVVLEDGDMELRDYAAQIVAEVEVEGDFDEAGNDAFRPLFNYISGDNTRQQEIAMTAPVAQEKASEEIAMTAPVSQRSEGASWAVSFMMPSSYTMDTIPSPTNPAVTIREIPPHRMAAVRYSGRWTEANYQEHLGQLNAWIEAQGLDVIGAPVWARYNAPFSLWFLRRNEILIPVAAD